MSGDALDNDACDQCVCAGCYAHAGEPCRCPLRRLAYRVLHRWGYLTSGRLAFLRRACRGCGAVYGTWCDRCPYGRHP